MLKHDSPEITAKHVNGQEPDSAFSTPEMKGERLKARLQEQSVEHIEVIQSLLSEVPDAIGDPKAHALTKETQTSMKLSERLLGLSERVKLGLSTALLSLCAQSCNSLDYYNMDNPSLTAKRGTQTAVGTTAGLGLVALAGVTINPLAFPLVYILSDTLGGLTGIRREERKDDNTSESRTQRERTVTYPDGRTLSDTYNSSNSIRRPTRPRN